MHKPLFILTMLSLALGLAPAACTSPSTKSPVKAEAPLIEKSTMTIADGRLNQVILNNFGRLSDPQLSPDGQQVLYGVSYTSIEQNKSNRELFIIQADGSNNHRITESPKSENNARWYGQRILFLTGGQLWVMDADGQNRTRITGTEQAISEFTLSPTQDKILFVSNVPSGHRPTDINPTLDKATGRYIDQLMYRHWDCFVEEIPHSFVANFDGKRLSEVTDLLEGQPFELPTLPFGGIGELAWSPDGKHIAYSCRKLTDVAYATSTNTDIFVRDLATGTEQNVTEGMMGYDTAPQYAPDGAYLVWCSMERDGYEADKNRLFCMDLATGQKRDLTADFPYNVESITFKPDGKGLYFTSCALGVTQLFEVSLPLGTIRQVTNGRDVSCGSLTIARKADGKDVLIGTIVSLSMPSELASIDPETGAYTQITFENKHLLDQLTMGRVEERWITTTDQKKMLTWVIYPPHFDANKKYPMMLFCAGGPQSTLSQGWSYRWCHQVLAANDYIVILPNRRGTTAFGQEWCEQISGDYAGQNMRDYLSAVDAMTKEPFVDKARVGASGASYGGYSIYYLAGHHDKRFAAFVAHAGIFNTEHMYMETEEIWFPHWDNGGAPWDTNPVATRHYAQSPHKSILKWDTPILITAGELDYRVPVDQAMSAFNAAKLVGVPAEMLLFPDENHWILKPQNSIMWHDVYIAFLNKYLKP